MSDASEQTCPCRGTGKLDPDAPVGTSPDCQYGCGAAADALARIPVEDGGPDYGERDSRSAANGIAPIVAAWAKLITELYGPRCTTWDETCTVCLQWTMHDTVTSQDLGPAGGSGAKARPGVKPTEEGKPTEPDAYADAQTAAPESSEQTFEEKPKTTTELLAEGMFGDELRRAYEDGVRAERSRIVAWLKTEAEKRWPPIDDLDQGAEAYAAIAERIERGDHA